MHLAPVTDVSTKAIREQNRRMHRRRLVIDRIVEQLDVFGVLLVAGGLTDVAIADHDNRYTALSREQATKIYDAVVALTKE